MNDIDPCDRTDLGGLKKLCMELYREGRYDQFNDVEDAYKEIREARLEVARLTRERNAFLVGIVSAAVDDDDHPAIEELFNDKSRIIALIGEAIEETENSTLAKWLDLPSDLKGA